jgi:hypothetical protein
LRVDRMLAAKVGSVPVRATGIADSADGIRRQVAAVSGPSLAVMRGHA